MPSQHTSTLKVKALPTFSLVDVNSSKQTAQHPRHNNIGLLTDFSFQSIKRLKSHRFPIAILALEPRRIRSDLEACTPYSDCSPFSAGSIPELWLLTLYQQIVLCHHALYSNNKTDDSRLTTLIPLSLFFGILGLGKIFRASRPGYLAHLNTPFSSVHIRARIKWLHLRTSQGKKGREFCFHPLHDPAMYIHLMRLGGFCLMSAGAHLKNFEILHLTSLGIAICLHNLWTGGDL